MISSWQCAFGSLGNRASATSGADQAITVQHAKPGKDARITACPVNPSFSVFINVLATIDI
jgi:hypothetical protein